MLIRSQDKRKLVPLGQLLIKEDPVSVDADGNPVWLIITTTSYDWVGAYTGTDMHVSRLELGEYDSAERAEEVLDEISKAYQKSLRTRMLGSIAHGGEQVPYLMAYNEVFEMPEE